MSCHSTIKYTFLWDGLSMVHFSHKFLMKMNHKELNRKIHHEREITYGIVIGDCINYAKTEKASNFYCIAFLSI